MNKVKRSSILFFALAFALLPAAALAQSTTDTQAAQTAANAVQTATAALQGLTGIFSCNQQGSYAMSVGALGASGGVYVPVADASVELDTGTLVYKECILREVVDAQRQLATAGFTQSATQQIQTGRNGSAEYVVNEGQELTSVGANAVVRALQNGTLSSLDPVIQTQVENAAAQGYAAATYNGAASLGCPYQGATTAFTSTGQPLSSWNTILAIGSDCNPIFAYVDTSNMLQNVAQTEENCQMNQWQWGLGFYAVTSGTQGPCENTITTPSSLVNSSYTQVVQSGFNQLQNANDLGQMVGALFGGISTAVLNSTSGGLAGLTQSTGGEPSYLEQAITQTTQNLSSTVTNAALANLDEALQVEQQYYSVMNSIATLFTDAITDLQGTQSQCWNQIIQAVCSNGGTITYQNGQPTCTAQTSCSANTTGLTTGLGSAQVQTGQECPAGATLHIATSTSGGPDFAQAVVSSQIAAAASTTIQNISVSQQSLNLINQLIASVSGASADAQAVALEQLNALEANNELHTPNDLSTAQSQEQSVGTFLGLSGSGGGTSVGTTGLVPDTVNEWAGQTGQTDANGNPVTTGWDGNVNDPTGWCNFTNQTTLQLWIQKWSQS